MYCILRAQDNVRSNILSDAGRAKEVQSKFIVLLEDAIRQSDFAKSVQHYWQAVDKAKVCLDLAAVPRAWLVPSRMVINTERTVAYNNLLN